MASILVLSCPASWRHGEQTIPGGRVCSCPEVIAQLQLHEVWRHGERTIPGGGVCPIEGVTQIQIMGGGVCLCPKRHYLSTIPGGGVCPHPEGITWLQFQERWRHVKHTIMGGGVCPRPEDITKQIFWVVRFIPVPKANNLMNSGRWGLPLSQRQTTCQFETQKKIIKNK